MDDKTAEEIRINNYALVYKPLGKTPKEVLDIYLRGTGKKKGAFYGRLDPMAHGIIKLYFDEKCKDAMETVEKTYKFIMVSGFSSTSEDLLGYPKYERPKEINEKELLEALEVLKGEEYQEIPVHSSFPVSNKEGEKRALWEWAKLRRLDEIERPILKRKLLEYEINSWEKTNTQELIEVAIERINMVDRRHLFEQDEIILEYQKLLESLEKEEIQKITITAKVENGYYIRQMVKRISELISIPLITFEIERISY